MIYSVSGYDFIEFRITEKVPDPAGSDPKYSMLNMLNPAPGKCSGSNRNRIHYTAYIPLLTPKSCYLMLSMLLSPL